MLVPRHVLEAVLKLRDASTSRYALNGVRLVRTPDYPIAMATDGRRGIACTWQEPKQHKLLDETRVDGWAETIEAQSALNAAKGAKPKAAALTKRPELGYVAVDESTTSASLQATNGETTVSVPRAALEGKFPDLLHPFKHHDPRKSEDAAVAYFDAKLLAETLLAMAQLVGGERPSVCITLTSEAVIMTHNSEILKAAALVMPLYGKQKDNPDDNVPFLIMEKPDTAASEHTEPAAEPATEPAEPEPVFIDMQLCRNQVDMPPLVVRSWESSVKDATATLKKTLLDGYFYRIRPADGPADQARYDAACEACGIGQQPVAT